MALMPARDFMVVGMRRSSQAATGLALLAVVATGCSPAATSPSADHPSPTSTVDYSSPLASAKGWIAYHRHGRDFPDHVVVHLVRTDGTEDHEIGADVEPGAIHHHPDWSPDGRQLLFDVQGEPDQLYVMNADGSDARIVTDCVLPECVGATHASWSRDGTRIAAAYAIGPLGPQGPARLGLAIIDVDSGARTVILDHDAADGQDLYPRWSADDEQLVFWRERDDETTAIFVLDVDGTNLTQLTEWDQFAGDPDWSPDGTLIVFTTYPLRVFGVAERSDLYTMKPDGTEVRQLTHLDGSRATQPRWTPDGEAITYTRVEPSGRPRHIWAIRSDGTDDSPVLTTSNNITHAVLQPTP
jgi:Tol biopolymer transport system component